MDLKNVKYRCVCGHCHHLILQKITKHRDKRLSDFPFRAKCKLTSGCYLNYGDIRELSEIEKVIYENK